MIQQFSSLNESEIKNVRKKAAVIAERAQWKHFIHFYDKAYNIALLKKNKRMKEIE